jgi:hypothetical protein
MSWCRVCGRYHQFGACPERELQDPPYPGLDEKAIAASDHQKAPPLTGPGISLDGQPSVRLQTRGQP